MNTTETEDIRLITLEHEDDRYNELTELYTELRPNCADALNCPDMLSFALQSLYFGLILLKSTKESKTNTAGSTNPYTSSVRFQDASRSEHGQIVSTSGKNRSSNDGVSRGYSADALATQPDIKNPIHDNPTEQAAQLILDYRKAVQFQQAKNITQGEGCIDQDQESLVAQRIYKLATGSDTFSLPDPYFFDPEEQESLSSSNAVNSEDAPSADVNIENPQSNSEQNNDGSGLRAFGIYSGWDSYFSEDTQETEKTQPSRPSTPISTSWWNNAPAPVATEPDRLPLIGFVYMMPPPSTNVFAHGVEQPGEVNVGVVIKPAYRRQGYAHQAVELVVDWAFQGLQFHRVQGLIIDSLMKGRAISLFTQMSFSHEGTRRRALYSPCDESWKDVTSFAILDTEWMVRGYFKPAPKSLWDELFARHQREREEMLKWESKVSKLKRSLSTETIKAQTKDELTAVDSLNAMFVDKGKSKEGVYSPAKRKRVKDNLGIDYDSSEDEDLNLALKLSAQEQFDSRSVISSHSTSSAFSPSTASDLSYTSAFPPPSPSLSAADTSFSSSSSTSEWDALSATSFVSHSSSIPGLRTPSITSDDGSFSEFERLGDSDIED